MADRPDVQGQCPACGATSLFLGDGGYPTCRRAECPDPTAAADLLLHGPSRIPALDLDARDRKRAIVAALLGRYHDPELIDWNGYMGQEVERLTEYLDRDLRTLADFALGDLRRLHEGRFPDLHAGFDQRVRSVQAGSARLLGLLDATVNAAARAKLAQLAEEVAADA